MGTAVLVLAGKTERDKAINWIAKAPVNSRVTFQGPRRSLDQNSRLWAMLSDVSNQVTYHGLRLSPDDYKVLFMDALDREARMVPNIDGNGLVNLGRSSSNLSKADFTELMDLIEAWGAQNGVAFSKAATS